MILYYSKYLRTFNIIGSNRNRAFLSHLLRIDNELVLFETLTIILASDSMVHKVFGLSQADIILYLRNVLEWIFFNVKIDDKKDNYYKIRPILRRKMFLFILILFLNNKMRFNTYKHLTKGFIGSNKYMQFSYSLKSDSDESEFFHLRLDRIFNSIRSRNFFKKNFHIFRFNSLNFKNKFQLLNISFNLKKLIKSEYKTYFGKKTLFFQSEFLKRIQKPFQNSFFILGEGCDFYPGH